MKGLSVNDECSLWCSGNGENLMLVWNRRKESLYGGGSDQAVRQTNPIQSARPMTFVAMRLRVSVLYY